MGRKATRGLKVQVGRECCIGKAGYRWARLNSGGIQTGRVRGGSHSVGKCGIFRRRRDTAGRAALGVRAA